MDNEKIGKLIALCRKKEGLTQKGLAEKLGVSDKSVSKWECGLCLPDVSLYKELCNILKISLNEFFAGEFIAKDEFIKTADDNLMLLLKDSSFTLKERIAYFKEKWQNDHFGELIMVMLIIIFLIIYGFIKNEYLALIGMLLGFISSIIEYNKMMAYIEKNAYGKNGITLSEFKGSLETLKKTKKMLSNFKTKEEAIEFWAKESGLSQKECAEAYDFLLKMDIDMIE